MEFIKEKTKKIYTIETNDTNDYLKIFLQEKGLLVSGDIISFGIDSISSLADAKLNDNYITKFIYDLGYQILYLKNNNLGIKYFDINDIIVINSNIFVFINPNKIFKLVDRKDEKLYRYGKVNMKVFNESEFVPPEFTKDSKDSKDSKDIYYTSSFYSLAKLILYIFDLNLEKLYFTQLYFFLDRCLVDKPENRKFLYA